ncbi:MAG: molybdopterin converting factor subunit 1 [Glaciecola sp.]|jgi:molybdopterin synthase sulfur carrier subunit
MVKLKFFAQLRERLGTASINIEYAGQKTVADLKDALLEQGEKWTLLKEQDVLCAVNQTLCGQDARINDGDEIAFFPPVTGG